MIDKIAVVTGSNRGIGYGIVKALCKRGVRFVYLTSRDVNRGLQAVKFLKLEGVNPEYHQLDVTDAESVKIFANHLRNKHGGIDILINNAGVASNNFDKTTLEDSEHVINVNYRSYYNIQDYLFPILNDNARVINISSDCGHISSINNRYWIEILSNIYVHKQDIDNFVNWFLESVKNNTLNIQDFGAPYLIAYRVSKVAVSALTRVQQRQIGRGISINSLHPGFVKTDMTGYFGVLSIDEASETPVFLALDCDQSVKGKYVWYDKSVKNWSDTTLRLFNNKNDEEAEKLGEKWKII